MDFSSIRRFFERNPLAIIGLGVVLLGVIIVIATGTNIGVSRFFAATDQGGGGGATATCTLTGTTCNGDFIFNHYSNCNGANGENCATSGKVCQNNNGSPTVVGATCVTPAGATPTPTPGGGGSSCGPSVPEGGDFSWSFKTSEPWEDCVDGQSNAQVASYTTIVTVGTCHPDDLHLVWRAEHRDKQSCDAALAGPSISEGAGITTDNGNFNDGNDLPNGEAGTAKMTYITSTFNCGSVRMWGAFWATGPESNSKNAGNTGYYKVVNYGVDCGGVQPTATSTAAPTPTPTAIVIPTPTPVIPVSLIVDKYGRNLTQGTADTKNTVTLAPGDTIQFTLRISNQTSVMVGDILVRDSLPSQLVPEGQVAEVITTQGLHVTELLPQDERVITWRANALGAAQLPVGTVSITAVTQVSSENYVGATLQLPIAITNTTTGVVTTVTGGNVGQVGTVQTGPGDALVLALIVGAFVSLLYVSWTHTPLFRERQVRSLAEDKDTMDFKA